MSGQWTEVQRSSAQYGWSIRLSNIPIHAWDRLWHRHANRGGSRTEVRRACVCVVVDELDHMRCEYKSEGIDMPNTCKKNKLFVDDGPDVHAKCDEWKTQLCVKNAK